MSYINDALRRAQAQKDSRYANYNPTVFASSSRRTGKKRRWIAAGGAVLILSAAISFAFYYRSEISSVTSRDIVKPPAPQSAPAPPQPTDPATLGREALKMQKTGNLGEAEQIYRKILARQPDNASAVNNIGVIYMTQGRKDEAIGMFNYAITLKDTDVDAYYNLACLYARTNDREQSLQFLKKAAAMNPDVKRWAKEDQDLKGLKALAEFKKIVE